ncbi:hypothetical protein KKH18_09400, partial [bacterium]|nr:hypothetical protein [bacterium]
TEGMIPYTTINATTDGRDEPEFCDFASYSHIESDVWFLYFASCSGLALVDLCDSDYDTKIAVYPGPACDYSTDPIACNDDFCDLQSLVEFPATFGEVYLIRIGGYVGYQGSGNMFITCGEPVARTKTPPPMHKHPRHK